MVFRIGAVSVKDNIAVGLRLLAKLIYVAVEYYITRIFLTRRRRPCREWLDDIKERVGEEIHKLSRKARDQCKWRTAVRTSIGTAGRVDEAMDGCCYFYK